MGFRSSLALALLAVSPVTLAAPASGVRIEFQGGRSYMDSYPTNVAFVEGIFRPRPLGHSQWHWSPDVSLGWVSGRHVARYRDSHPSTRPDVWLLAGGVRLQYGQAGYWSRHLFVSFQPAVTSGRTQALSTAYEFVSSLGWQGRHLSLQIRHISNASLHQPNRGETMALVGVGFDF